ncbi:sulfite exporter TauE/SafE family protein [uncultured Roseovarius sp.]|uniref:sulfite exporter TauE/SafE family protein n=1 Tax=uncultured Roseovarius sp. TaxID=293344 RepID=UPI00261D1EA8|nr:sulfite exporter TauE/SafE family protein [uncultured Roseovarius sp.]
MAGHDIGIIALGALAAIFAGVSKGGFGSGAAFASVSVLALVLPPAQALGIMLPLLMLIDAATLRPYWRRWSWPETRALLWGGVPGTALGAALYTIADADLFRLLIGGISLAFVGWQFSARAGLIHPARTPLPGWAGLLAGIIAGFTSFVSHAGGPVAAVYLLSRRLDKTAFQATTVLLFALLNVMKFVPYAYLGIFTAETLKLDLILAPFALFGAWLGVKAHWLVSERMFFAVTYVALTVTGLKLIWDALG